MNKILIFVLAGSLLIYNCVSREDISDDFHGRYALDKIESYNPIDKTWADAPGREGTSGFILYDDPAHSNPVEILLHCICLRVASEISYLSKFIGILI